MPSCSMLPWALALCWTAGLALSPFSSPTQPHTPQHHPEKHTEKRMKLDWWDVGRIPLKQLRLRGGTTGDVDAPLSRRGQVPISHPEHPEWGETHLPGASEAVHKAWEETMKMRDEYDRREQEMDYDLRTSTSRVIEEIDRLKEMREQQQKEELERNGPRWVPPINRHFMDPTNYTSEFGPEFHPPYPVVPTLAMMDPSTRLRESACRGRTYEIYEQVEKEGADVNKPDDAGQYSAIHWASLMGKTDTVKALLELGADPNALTRHDKNALHYACEEGRTDIVPLLLEAGSDAHQRDLDGMRPIDLARAGGHVAASTLVYQFMETHPELPPEERKAKQPKKPVYYTGYVTDGGYTTAGGGYRTGYATDDASYYTDDEDLKRMGGGKDFGSLWGRTIG